MRRLIPADAAGEVDMDDAYWIEDVGHQHVRAAMVASVDGAAQADGRAGGLSGPADVALLSTLRGQADVILAGAGTVRAEGYGGEIPSAERQERRRSRGLSAAPPIAVVTGSGDLDLRSPFFIETVVRPIIITSEQLAPDRRAALEEVADVITAGTTQVDLSAALDALAERGLKRVHCEGGPHLLAQLVAQRRLDELSLTISPVVVAAPSFRIVESPAGGRTLTMDLTEVFEEESFLFLRYRPHGSAQ